MCCAAIFVLAGCATRVDITPSRLAEGTPVRVAFQSMGISPDNGGRIVPSTDLRPGGILLSASNGITSGVIRAATLSPVSHAALYIGDGVIVEAVGTGIRSRRVDDSLLDESVVVAFRHPRFNETHVPLVRDFANSQLGRPYNHLGIVLQAPFSVQRRLCELPLVPEIVRDACIRGVALIQLGAGSNDRFFCSQFVLEAYRRAGLPMTSADPRLVSPADLLHMRAGDVSSVRTEQTLEYVGHLKYEVAALP